MFFNVTNNGNILNYEKDKYLQAKLLPNFYNKKLVRLVFAKMDSCNHNVTIK